MNFASHTLSPVLLAAKCSRQLMRIYVTWEAGWYMSPVFYEPQFGAYPGPESATRQPHPLSTWPQVYPDAQLP